MARRKSRRKSVAGRPNYVWIASSGTFAPIYQATAYDALLIPGDWSGTVTEQGCTLLRLTLQCYTQTATAGAGAPHAENCAITLDGASDQTVETLNLSDINDWPDWMITHDRVLHTFRLEWDGTLQPNVLPVQFSQLPEPVMNLKRPRRLTGQDSVRLWCGGRYNYVDDVPIVVWFCRSLVRLGLK